MVVDPPGAHGHGHGWRMPVYLILVQVIDASLLYDHLQDSSICIRCRFSRFKADSSDLGQEHLLPLLRMPFTDSNFKNLHCDSLSLIFYSPIYTNFIFRTSLLSYSSCCQNEGKNLNLMIQIWTHVWLFYCVFSTLIVSQFTGFLNIAVSKDGNCFAPSVLNIAVPKVTNPNLSPSHLQVS